MKFRKVQRVSDFERNIFLTETTVLRCIPILFSQYKDLHQWKLICGTKGSDPLETALHFVRDRRTLVCQWWPTSTVLNTETATFGCDENEELWAKQSKGNNPARTISE